MFAVLYRDPPYALHSESSELYRKINLMIYCDSFERYGGEVILLEYIIIGHVIAGGGRATTICWRRRVSKNVVKSEATMHMLLELDIYDDSRHRADIIIRLESWHGGILRSTVKGQLERSRN